MFSRRNRPLIYLICFAIVTGLGLWAELPWQGAMGLASVAVICEWARRTFWL